MDDFGVVISTYTETMSSLPPRNVSSGAVLANLSLSDPTIQDRGCVLVNLTCNDVPCARDSDTDATVYWNFYVNTRGQAGRVLDALRKLASFYPEGPARSIRNRSREENPCLPLCLRRSIDGPRDARGSTARATSAMDIHEFKRMAGKDQDEYVGDLVGGGKGLSGRGQIKSWQR